MEERLRSLEKTRQQLADSWAMAEQLAEAEQLEPVFWVGDKVWLEGKNIRTMQPSAKLAAKRHGPFEIIEVLGPVSY